MIFELGKTYIVDVTEKGIIPSMEFDKERWYDKDHDDLDFLTDEEKTVVINEVLDKIRADIKGLTYYGCEIPPKVVIDDVIDIIDKCRQEG